MVTPGYFRTLGIPLVGGRDFSMDDRPDDPDAFIVSQSFVDRFLSGRDPLTTSIALSDNPYGRIVGVVGNVKEDSLRGQTQPTVFFTYSQVATSTDMIVFLRADNAETLAPAAVAAIQEIDPDVPVYQIRLLEAVFGESIARDRLNAVLSGAFALTALSLAAFGVYGLLSYLVSERTREIGIRTALGARTSEVSRMVLGHTLWLVIPGLVAGLAGALALTRLIEGLLYGVASRDPATFAAVVGLTVAVGAIAALVPARRAARVDPLTALRQE
jgi:putative ABC transport system permease protein